MTGAVLACSTFGRAVDDRLGATEGAEERLGAGGALFLGRGDEAGVELERVTVHAAKLGVDVVDGQDSSLLSRRAPCCRQLPPGGDLY
jgi:hypothetical protein